MRTIRAVQAATILAIAMGATAAPAMAEPTTTCRASALRVQLASVSQEPILANAPGTPCYNRRAVAGTISAETSDFGSSVNAFTGFAAIGFVIPGIVELSLGDSVRTSAFAYCSGTTPVLGSFSHTHDIQVYPSAFAPPILVTGQDPQTIPIAGVGTLQVNREIKTANRVTRQGLFLDTALVDKVIGESTAGITC